MNERMMSDMTKTATAAASSLALYNNFINSMRSDATKQQYTYCLNRYMQYCHFDRVDQLVKDQQTPKIIEANIIQYIVWLKQEQKLSSVSVELYLSAIMHFYSMNDIVLNRKKIGRYLGQYVRKQKDRAYTTEEIHRLLDFCDERSKALVLLLASSGIRIGSVCDLKLRHLRKIPEYQLYHITIYEGTKEEYYCFTTPEAAAAIDTYLEYRKRCGEKLTANSPLFREQFDVEDLFSIKYPKSMKTRGLTKLLIRQLNRSGVMPIGKETEDSRRGQKRNVIARAHGFRKFVTTNMIRAKLNAEGGYMSDDDKQAYIRYLEDPNKTRIREGEGRHPAIKTLGCSYFNRRANGWKDLTDDQRKERLEQWNQQHCVPPLPEPEFDSIWKWVVDTHRKTRDERNERLEDERLRKTLEDQENFGVGIKLDYNIRQELEGNTHYIIKDKPLTVVIAYNKTKMLIESSEKSFDNKVFDTSTKEQTTQKFKVLSQRKLYLTCIPVSITKHKNPLSFLEAAPKYTMRFVDSVGNHPTFKYKTLSEIISGLRDNGYVQSDGAEGALGVMILAFTKNKQLVENYDMEYTGFFLDDATKKIIASNVEIKNDDDVSVERLKEALKVIEEAAAKYYSPNPDRLDLLATSIIWGMVAPISFVFKSNICYLHWLHFWGSPNATKSNTGVFILAIDGHHKDSKYIRNISNIDTIARLGEEVGKTTFPKLVDEVDLNEQNLRYGLINLYKSAISSKILRSKFLHNGRSAVDIPALSPLILTSNPPPPLSDSAYMKRVIDRYFDKSESRKEDDPIAAEFRQFLTTELDKLCHLGDFRNWYVMNHQDAIMSAFNVEKITLLDLGMQLLKAAYEYTGLSMPEWLINRRIPQSQLENSFIDNKTAVKNAFETLINVNLKNFSRFDMPEQFPTMVSDRVALLLNGNKLPFMKLDRTKANVIINTGILPELYKHGGVTRDQLPNLKALADELNASYRRDKSGQIAKAVWPKAVVEYFDTLYDD